MIFGFYSVAIITGDAVCFEFDSLTDCFFRNFIYLEEKLVSLEHSLLSLIMKFRFVLGMQIANHINMKLHTTGICILRMWGLSLSISSNTKWSIVEQNHTLSVFIYYLSVLIYIPNGHIKSK